RLDLAQYRELAAFAQFGSELDQATKEQLAQGERVREMLKQPQYEPMSVEDQVLVLYAATRKYLLKLPTAKVRDYETSLLEYVHRRRPELPDLIREKKELTEEVETLMKEVLDEFTAQFLKEQEA
ncbi:MAG: F0F1 ATP synthase subunit alpha, partial [Lachnospiraceae bacterium]|nr:F0F1 ATP synthase subunit alpha [Lachnospiraceae bacterium]